MAVPSKATGGCLCGAVRFRVTRAPKIVTLCHCRLCQRSVGAPVVAWAIYDADAVEVTRGRLAEHASTPKARRGFCAACGTSLTFQEVADPATLDVTVASFDAAEDFAPQDHIWTVSQMPWLVCDDHLPRRREGHAWPLVE